MKNNLKNFAWRLFTVFLLAVILGAVVVGFVPVSLYYLIQGEDLTIHVEKWVKRKGLFGPLS